MSQRYGTTPPEDRPVKQAMLRGALGRCPACGKGRLFSGYLSVKSACPDCGGPVRVRIDPLTFAFPRPEAVLREVHAIAMAYRWSERAILDLPSRRRRAYVALIAGDADSRAARPRGGMRLS